MAPAIQFLTSGLRAIPQISCRPSNFKPLIRKMSFKTTVSNLRSPVKELVLSATKDGKEFFGHNDADKQEISGWIDKTAQESFVYENNLKDLEALLISKTYLAGNHLTAADIALYGTLHPIVAKLQVSECYALPAITRYFDHIQSFPAVQNSASSLGAPFETVSFDLENAPKAERKTETSKKKDGKPKAPVVGPEALSAQAISEGSESSRIDKRQKEKKGHSIEVASSSKVAGSSSKKGSKLPAEDDGEPLPSMIDLRVGHIVNVTKHPDADSLYVEQIDLGEDTGPRTVVSGLVNYIPIEQMRDKYLVAVCNLKPANMRGVKSFAMVLCATSKEGKEGGIELIQPPPGSKPGERVYFEGEGFEAAVPLSQLNPKKKIFETIQPGFTTLDTKEAAWINPVTKKVHKIRTANGTCVAPTLVGASLS